MIPSIEVQVLKQEHAHVRCQRFLGTKIVSLWDSARK
jgi:hypothetical protein